MNQVLFKIQLSWCVLDPVYIYGQFCKSLEVEILSGDTKQTAHSETVLKYALYKYDEMSIFVGNIEMT